MSFPVDEKLPRTYFLDIMNAQVMMVKTYLDDLDNPLIFFLLLWKFNGNFQVLF